MVTRRCLRRIALVTVAVLTYGWPVSAWEWPGRPVSRGDVADSPGMPIETTDEGLFPVHDGIVRYVSPSTVVVDHGNDLWSVYGVDLTVDAISRLDSAPFVASATDPLVFASELTSPVVYLSFWDQRTQRWVDPRLLLTVPESTVQKIVLVGFQEGRVAPVADLSPGRAAFYVGTGLSRLESPQEIALLLNGETIGRVRLADIARTPVREFFGERYLEVGSGILREGLNQVEVLVFDYAGNRRVHETTLAIRSVQ